jgi:hypothetical protein
MGADRINVVEGILDDLAHGKVPNIPAEMGLRAEWKHNKGGLIVKLAATAAVTVALATLFGGHGKGDGRRPLTRGQRRRSLPRVRPGQELRTN